jgi:hypothetical protein
MIFYKNVFISTILSVILLLAIVAYILYSSKNKQIYPPVLSSCPDYYGLNDSKLCVNSGVWSNTDPSCNNIDFNGNIYKMPGTNSTSGICAKKNLAVKCGIDWDGITNNDSIC